MRYLEEKDLESLSKEDIKKALDSIGKEWVEEMRASISFLEKAREKAFGKHLDHKFLDIREVIHMIEDIDGDDDLYTEFVYWVSNGKKLEDFKVALKEFEKIVEKK